MAKKTSVNYNAGAPDRIAVIMPVKNDDEGFHALLTQITSQTFAPDEIIIVNTGEPSYIYKLCQPLIEKNNTIRILLLPNGTPGEARNFGIQHTDADIIVHMDSGCRVDQQWLDELTGPLRAGEADYVTGSIAPMEAEAQCMRFSFDIGLLLYACSQWQNRYEGGMAGGASAAYRRWVWERVGGQPGRMLVCEDLLFTEKIRPLNIVTRYAENSLCYWQIGPRIRDALKRKWRYINADFVVPVARKSVIQAYRKAILTAALGAGSFVFPWLLAAIAGLHGALIFKEAMKAHIRYRKMAAGTGKSLPPAVSFVLVYSIVCCIYILETVSAVSGTYARLAKWRERRAMKQYLARYPANGLAAEMSVTSKAVRRMA